MRKEISKKKEKTNKNPKQTIGGGFEGVQLILFGFAHSEPPCVLGCPHT